MPHQDPDDEGWYDDEVDDSDSDAIPCPDCGVEIYADLDHCPNCGYWLTDADRRTQDGATGLYSSRGVRIIAAVLLALFVLGLLAGTLGL